MDGSEARGTGEEAPKGRLREGHRTGMLRREQERQERKLRKASEHSGWQAGEDKGMWVGEGCDQAYLTQVLQHPFLDALIFEVAARDVDDVLDDGLVNGPDLSV